MKNKNFYIIITIIILIVIIIVFGKFVIHDCILGIKVYNENDIVIKYHRFINVFSVKNNSDSVINFHYQSGTSRGRGTGGTVYTYDITNYKRSDTWEIEIGEKFVKWAGMFSDGYIFTVSNDNGLYDSSEYNKHVWF